MLHLQRAFLYTVFETPGSATPENIEKVFPKLKTHNDEIIYVSSIPNTGIDMIRKIIPNIKTDDEDALSFDVIEKMSVVLSCPSNMVSPYHLSKMTKEQLLVFEPSDDVIHHITHNLYGGVYDISNVMKHINPSYMYEVSINKEIDQLNTALESMGIDNDFGLYINNKSGGNTIQNVLNILDGNVLRYSPSKYRKDLTLCQQDKVSALEQMGYHVTSNQTSDGVPVFYAISPDSLSMAVEDGRHNLRLIELVSGSKLVSALENFQCEATTPETLILKTPKEVVYYHDK